MVRTEEILNRIRREIAEKSAADGPPVATAAELEYLKRNSMLFDPASAMHSHRGVLAPIAIAFKRVFRRLVVGVLDGYFDKERRFLGELVRLQSALAERTDRLERELAALTEKSRTDDEGRV